MDTPTHGIIGRLVARTVWPGRRDNGLVNLATLCSVLPDADVFIPGDRLARLETHRGFSHSFFGALVIRPVRMIINRIEDEAERSSSYRLSNRTIDDLR